MADNVVEKLAKLTVSEDKMSAWLYLSAPDKKNVTITRNDIVEYLKQNGVTRGLHTSNIAAMAAKGIYGRDVLVAKGLEPLTGKDGYYEWKVDVNSKKSPAIRSDGSVDYSSLSHLPTIEEGKVVAVYHRAELSHDGYDVTGNVFEAEPVADLEPLKGLGVSNEKDPDVYVAAMSGLVEYRDGNIDIKGTHKIDGNVDLIVGKVEVYGDVEIDGNVESGVIIRASRNVFISGCVEAAFIYAGGDVVIKKGISGGLKGKITAKGDVSADFIEHCTVEAEGNVRANSFLNATVTAGGMVLAEGKNGSIVNGHVRGLLGVAATSIGNEAEVATFVASGYSHEEHEKYLALYVREDELQNRITETVSKITAVLKEKREAGDVDLTDYDVKLFELNEKKDKLFEELDAIRAVKQADAGIIEKGKGSVVVVNGNIYRNVTITVEGNSYQVEENTSFMKYKNEAGRVIPAVI